MISVEKIKNLVLKTIHSLQLTNVYMGVVTQEEPLEIEVDGRFTIKGDRIILARDLTEYKHDMTVNHDTELEYDHNHPAPGFHIPYGGRHDRILSLPARPEDASITGTTEHFHKYKGRWTFVVHDYLETGEQVIMISLSGGQRYYVIDRLEKPGWTRSRTESRNSR